MRMFILGIEFSALMALVLSSDSAGNLNPSIVSVCSRKPFHQSPTHNGSPPSKGKTQHRKTGREKCRDLTRLETASLQFSKEPRLGGCYLSGTCFDRILQQGVQL